MKLFGQPGSTCTRKVLCTLAEKNAEAEFVLVDLSKGEQKSPEHLARHPFGVIPVLDDDGFVLYEARAIIRYLDQRLPGISLTPSDVRDRARMEQWLSVEQSYFSAPALRIVKQTLWRRTGEMDVAVVEEAAKQIGHAFGVIDAYLKDHDYLAGNAFSLADISFMPYIHYLKAAGQGELIATRPHAKRWWEQISTRPSWKKVAG